MPTIKPIAGPTSWPSDEGVIGVVGVAPWATLAFLDALYRRVKVTKDWHFPRVISDINTKLPSRGRHLDLGERDPSPFILESIEELAEQGATVVVVPCNTAHILFERWAKSPPVPVPNIVDVSVEAIKKTGARKIATFSSGPVYRHSVYENALERAGLEPARLSEEEVALVGQAITQVKSEGALGAAMNADLLELLGRKRDEGVEGLIIACTELGAVQELCEQHGLAVADSGAALACAALTACRVPIHHAS